MKNKLYVITVLIVVLGAASGTTGILREVSRVSALTESMNNMRVTHTYEATVEYLPEVAPFIWSWPIDLKDYVKLSSPYGERDPKKIGGYGDEFHNGLDLYGTWLARIRSIANGKVIVHFYPPGGKYKGHKVLGGLVVIRHIIQGETWFSRYGHLSSTEVNEGDSVGPTTLLGRQGDTGRTKSPHLHFELYKGGVCDVDTGDILGGEEMNPLKYLKVPE